MSQDHAYALPAGYMLEEYRIERMLGSGGFGITYLAHDTHLGKRVAVKEYLPNDFAVRDAERTVRPKSFTDAGSYQWGLERFWRRRRCWRGLTMRILTGSIVAFRRMVRRIWCWNTYRVRPCPSDWGTRKCCRLRKPGGCLRNCCRDWKWCIDRVTCIETSSL